MAFVELENLHRSFGEVVALDGISISLEEGEFLSLLGPSGLRQDDRAAPRRRLRPAELGPHRSSTART